MNKQEFLALLRKGLSGLPQEDIDQRLSFYGEMIEDRKEDGLSEEEAVAAIGTVAEIVDQTVAETPLSKIAKERIRPKRRLSAGEITLLAVGSPLWLSLGIAAFAVLFALYVLLWAVIVALWAVFAAFVGCAVGGAVAGLVLIAGGHGAAGAVVLAAGFVCAGLSVFAFFGCRAATKGTAVLTKKSVIWIKNCFRRKERAE